MKKLAFLAIIGLALASCSKGDYYNGVIDEGGHYKGEDYDSEAAMDGGGDYGESGETGETGEQPVAEPGVITAGEWNDLDNWNFWGGLMTDTFKDYWFYWGMNTSNRFAVSVSDGENPVQGIKVELKDSEGKLLWTSVTDNTGKANLWADAFVKQGQTVIDKCTVTIGGQLMEGNPVVSDWSAEQPVVWNSYVVGAIPAPKLADIAFIVDATGSMGDEIDFLKQDLLDILDKVAQVQTDKKIYTGTVFYRDEGDTYLTRVSEFADKTSKTVDFVKGQEAAGGGDLPEAVHTALETALTKLQWHGEGCPSLAFLILDAPAHVDHNGVVKSLQKSIADFSAKGIKLIPVFCSSGDKTCEFMCRDFAILTGGTYVFLTNDSGVGGEHLTPSVGDYQVEKLRDLIIRLINKYLS